MIGTTGTQYTLTIADSGTSTNALGSANITVPAGFANILVGAPTTPGSKSWTAVDNGGVVELRATAALDALAPGEAVSVPLTADAPGTRGSTTWLTAADQSIDFSNTGAFTRVGGDPTVVVTGPLDRFIVAPAALSQTAGTPFDVTVTAADSDGTTVGSYTGTVQFSSTDTRGSTMLPAPFTFTSGDKGVHTFTSGVDLTTAGSQTVSVADTVATSATGTSGSIAVSAAPLDHFTVTNLSPAAPETANAPFSVDVTAFDAFGNAANGWTSTNGCVVFSGPLNSPNSTAPIYPGQGACSGSPAGQSELSFDSSGKATASGIKLFNAASTTLTVADAAQTHTGVRRPVHGESDVARSFHADELESGCARDC